MTHGSIHGTWRESRLVDSVRCWYHSDMSVPDSDASSRTSRTTWVLVAVALAVVVGLIVVFLTSSSGQSESSSNDASTSEPTGDVSSSATQLSPSPSPASEVGEVRYFAEGNTDDWRLFAVAVNGDQVTAEERYGPAGNDGGGCFVGKVSDGEYVGVLVADVGQRVTIPFKVEDGEIRLKGKWRGLKPVTENEVNNRTTGADQGPLDLARCEEYRDLIASGEVQVVD